MRSRNAIASPPAVALAVLAFAAGLLWLGQPKARATVASTPAPATLGAWTGTPLAVEPRAIEILETDDVSFMEYRLGEEPPVHFARVAGFGNRAAFHPPEICFVGSHFEVLQRGPMTVMANGKARRIMRLVIGQGKQRHEAWYWFTANGRVTSNYYQQQAWLLGDAIRRKPMSGTLVRISTTLDAPEQAHRRLLAFVSSWDALETAPVHGS